MCLTIWNFSTRRFGGDVFRVRDRLDSLERKLWVFYTVNILCFACITYLVESRGSLFSIRFANYHHHCCLEYTLHSLAGDTA